jgi:polar amino acid transport system permease protein
MWGFYFEQLIHSLPFFLKGLWMTVAVSGISLVAGTVLGFLWGIVRASRSRVLKPLIGGWVDLVRGTPFLVQIFIVFFILPEFGIHLDAFPAAVISLTNLSACFICEIVAAGIQSVPWGQKEAAVSTGLNGFQQLRHVVMPQAMRVILPPLVGQYVLLIKDSSVVSAIGVIDVTRVGWLTVQRIPQGLLVFGLVGTLYFAICYPLIRLSNTLEKRMSAGYRREQGEPT